MSHSTTRFSRVMVFLSPILKTGLDQRDDKKSVGDGVHRFDTAWKINGSVTSMLDRMLL